MRLDLAMLVVGVALVVAGDLVAALSQWGAVPALLVWTGAAINCTAAAVAIRKNRRAR